jgi:hypothetical protein
MKRKLTLTVDQSVIRAGKEMAKREGTSLSQLVEDSVRKRTEAAQRPFSEQWGGCIRIDERPDDLRLAYLKEHYK